MRIEKLVVPVVANVITARNLLNIKLYFVKSWQRKYASAGYLNKISSQSCVSAHVGTL